MQYSAFILCNFKKLATLNYFDDKINISRKKRNVEDHCGTRTRSSLLCWYYLSIEFLTTTDYFNYKINVGGSTILTQNLAEV